MSRDPNNNGHPLQRESEPDSDLNHKKSYAPGCLTAAGVFCVRAIVKVSKGNRYFHSQRCNYVNRNFIVKYDNKDLTITK